MTTDVLNPVIEIMIRGELIHVKELCWKDCLRAVKDLTGTVLDLLGPGGKTLVLDKEKIVKAIGSQEGLVTWVLEKSTGKDQAFITDLTAREVIPLVQAVVDLNLSDEVVNSGKVLAGRMGEVLGQTKSSPEQ